MKDFVIVRDYPLLIEYVDKLQRENAEALSFYPRCVFERERKNGRLWLGLLNNQPCGYIYIGALPNLKCHQVCIQYDARRRLYGASLVVAVEDYATKHQANSITLRCGFDLDANTFWKDLGYSCVGIVNGGIRRNRKINIWTKSLQPTLFEHIAIEPATGKQDATYWRKHKQTGIITQFHRGKNLRDYRMLLTKDEES